MKEKKKIGSKIFMAILMLFFYAPIIYIIVFSFNDSRSLTNFGGFSLRWYEKMFGDRNMMEAVAYTIGSKTTGQDLSFSASHCFGSMYVSTYSPLSPERRTRIS